MSALRRVGDSGEIEVDEIEVEVEFNGIETQKKSQVTDFVKSIKQAFGSAF